MGFNTTVFILNDTWHTYREDPKLLSDIITDGMSGRDAGFQGVRVVTCQHADTMNLILAGGNTARVIASSYNRRLQYSSTEDCILSMLKEAASELGYRLVKKPKKKHEEKQDA